MKLFFLKIHHLHRLCLRRPKICISFFTLFFLASVTLLPQLKILSNIDDLIDEDFSTYASLNELNDDYVNKNNALLMIRPRDRALNKRDYCAIRGWLNQEIARSNDLETIITTDDIKQLKINSQKFQFQSQLNINCHQKLGLDEALTPYFEKMYESSPWQDIFVTKENHDYVIDFYFAKTEKRGKFGNFDTSVVKDLFDSFQQFADKHSDFEFHWSGLASFQYHLRVAYEQTSVINLIIMVLIFFFFKLFWGSFLSGFLYILTVLVTSIIIYGGLALSNSPIDVLSNSISLMIFVSSIEDFIFLSFLRRKYKSWKLPFKKLLIPSFLTSLTTFIGFGSLYFTDMDIIRRFGTWAAIGALVEWCVLFLFLPALLQQFPKLRNWTKARKTKTIHFFEKINHIRFYRPLALALLIFIPISLFGVNKIRVSDSPQKIFPKSHVAWSTIDYISSSRQWQAFVSLVFKNKDEVAFNKSVLQAYQDSGLVVTIEDPYKIDDYITSPAKDNAMKDFFIGHWEDSLMGKKYNTKYGATRALLYIDDLDISYINKLSKKNQQLCPRDECHLAGSLVSYAEFGNRVLSSLFKSFAVSLSLVIFVLLGLMFYLKTRHKFFILVASLWGPLTLVSTFYIFDIPVSYVTSLIASIMVGLAGDNAIQYIYRRKSVAGDLKYFETASLLVTFCMVILSTAFFFSDFDSLRKLGFLMILGFIINYIGDVFILKSLVNKK